MPRWKTGRLIRHNMCTCDVTCTVKGSHDSFVCVSTVLSCLIPLLTVIGAVLVVLAARPLVTHHACVRDITCTLECFQNFRVVYVHFLRFGDTPNTVKMPRRSAVSVSARVDCGCRLDWDRSRIPDHLAKPCEHPESSHRPSV